jgi:hypothetical protein
MASTRAWMLWGLIPCHTRQQEWVRVAHAPPGHPTVYQGARCVHCRAIYPLYCSDYDRVMPRSQWQRIALARAFMRAYQPEVHFLLFDEPVRLCTSPFRSSPADGDVRLADVCSRRPRPE